MPKFVYIDNPSLWAEGRRASAVKKGKACDILDSIENNISDMEWSCDVGKLLRLIGCTKEDTKKAYLFGCYPPMSDSLWNEDIRCFLTTMNYWIRNPVDIVIRMVEDLYVHSISPANNDSVILVAGDADYVPAVNRLRENGIYVNLRFWDHASPELIQAATEFSSLNPSIDGMYREEPSKNANKT